MDPRTDPSSITPVTPLDPSQPSFQDFPHFLNNPVINQLAQAQKWTVSDTKKRPMDMWAMLDGQLLGASRPDSSTLMTLDQLNAALPQAKNNAFFLSYEQDKYMIIDIEKTCPEAVRNELLALPNLYSELSMSGHGYHLIVPAPQNVNEFPDALLKTVLRHPQGWYEVLLEHYVTFTRRPISEEILQAAANSPSKPTWEEIYASLARNVVLSDRAAFDVSEEAPDIPHRDDLVDRLSRRQYSRTLASFNHDHSAYEFGYAGFLWNQLKMYLKADKYSKEHEYSESDKAWIIYLTLVQVIPHRPKHDEARSGLPLLLNTATNLVALRTADEEEDDNRW